ncbi:MAG TPA: chaperone NapD [Symbiobacteriaceae bacterium]|nr:chaperone NapD [Symbiobacteriaceae bacterium]
MVIAGLVVQLLPQNEAAVLAAIAQVPGATYENTPAPGHAVVVLQAEDERSAEERLKELQAISGVLGVYPAYIHSEV